MTLSLADPPRCAALRSRLIRLLRLTDHELHDRCVTGAVAHDLVDADGAVVIEAGEDGTGWTSVALETLAPLPCLVVSGPRAGGPTAHLDAVAEPGIVDLDDILGAIETHPEASLALALLQRGSARRTTAEGLVAESATYSLLQAGPEFAAWLAGRPPHAHRPDPGPDDPLVVARDGARLALTLHRPQVRNALDVTMRDALVEALSVAVADPTITRVELRGAGPTFCSGGDLDEFGSAPDPVTAHRIRLATSIGRLIDRLRERVVVHVHGACRGSGVELPAFAGRVVAHPDATFALPEVGMGLIPGAGGTVSITRRIGPLRTTTWALSGAVIDAATALDWGLVDALKRW
jgi:hypothetical protein